MARLQSRKAGDGEEWGVVPNETEGFLGKQELRTFVNREKI